MKAATPKRRGFSLIEILCVMSLLALVTGILTLLLMQIMEVERSQAESFDKVLQDNALVDQFRADAAQATSAPQEWQQYKADGQTLILQMHRGHVVYLWHEGKLLRRDFEGEKMSERSVPVGNRVSVELVRDAAPSRLVRLRMLAVREGNPLPGQTLEIAAALGGDWR